MRIYVTNYDKNEGIRLCKSLPYPSSIAIRSAIFHISSTNLHIPSNIKIQKVGERQPLLYIKIPSGFYTPESFIQFVNTESKGMIKFQMVPGQQNVIQLTVQQGYEVSMIPALLKFLGIGISSAVKWIQAGSNYFGTPKFFVQEFQLYCKNIDPEKNLLNGEPSKLMQIFPMDTKYQLGEQFSYVFDNLHFIPLSSSTNRLEFTLLDKHGNERRNEVATMRLELIINEHL